MIKPLIDRATLGPILITAAVLLVGLVPLPGHRAKAILRSLRSPEPNRAERDAHAAGYYVGLIDGGPDSGRDELTLRLMGKSGDWKSFHEIGATRYLNDDLLQFELKPNLSVLSFGKRFTTNAQGLRDVAYPIAKPEGTFRIALLGSSMDMGWGVSTDETYENRLEDWLNSHAGRRGVERRYEVINFAMAAYSPLHRLESFRRKVVDYRPDLVVYSATMLDSRLLEIHIRNLLQEGIDLQYDFLRESLAGIRLESDRAELKDKDALKARLKPALAPLSERVIAEIAARCRVLDVPLALAIVPRVGQADSPENREASVARLVEIARRQNLPLLDLSATFDDHDPARIEIAPWDDHPNALGHELLFRNLARSIVADAPLYRRIFGVEPPEMTQPLVPLEDRPAGDPGRRPRKGRGPEPSRRR